MIKYKTEKRDIDIFESVTCDICKKEFIPPKDDMEIQEFLYIRNVGGYGSIFGDGNNIHYDFCQYCFHSWIKSWRNNE